MAWFDDLRHEAQKDFVLLTSPISTFHSNFVPNGVSFPDIASEGIKSIPFLPFRSNIAKAARSALPAIKSTISPVAGRFVKQYTFRRYKKFSGGITLYW